MYKVTIWFYFLCFVKGPVTAAISHSVHPVYSDELCPQDLQPYKNITNCNFYLSSDRKMLENKLKKIQWKDGTVQHFDFKISTINKTENSRTPLEYQWLMAYLEADGSFDFVSWRTDFKVFSFGLLNDYQNAPIGVTYVENSSSCLIKKETASIKNEIVKASTKFLMDIDLFTEKQYYTNIYFCYLTRYHWFDTKKPLYFMKINLGIPLQEFGYECCNLSNETVCCEPRMHNLEGYRIVPYVIGVAVFVFLFPLLMVIIGNSCISLETNNTETELNDFRQQLVTENHGMHTFANLVHTSNSMPIFLGIPWEWSNCCCSENRRNIIHIYEDTNFAICCKCEQQCCTMTDGLFTCCNSMHCTCNEDKFECFKCCDENNSIRPSKPICKSRALRAIFLALFPIVIYFEFIIFSIISPWKDTVTFLANKNILFGFTVILGDPWNNTFLPATHGPLWALLIFYALGLFIIVLPETFELSVVDKGAKILNYIGDLHPRGCSHLKGYKKVERILSTCVFLFLNPQFWKEITKRFSKTGVKGKMIALLCVLRYVISSVAFLFPIVTFSFVLLVGEFKYLYKITCKSRSCRTFEETDEEGQPILGQNSPKTCIVECIMYFIFFLLLAISFYFYYLFIVIGSYSCYVIVYVFYFLVLSFWVSPAITAHYVVLAVFGITFSIQVIRNSSKYYKDMFDLTVTECRENFSERYTITLNEATFISKGIVLLVQKQTRSIFIELGHMLLKVTFVCAIYYLTMHSVQKFAATIPDYLEHFTIGFIAVFPIVMQYVFKTAIYDRTKIRRIIQNHVYYISNLNHVNRDPIQANN